LKNTHIQKTTPVSQFLTEEQITANSSVNYTGQGRLRGVSLGLALSIAFIGSATAARAGANSSFANFLGQYNIKNIEQVSFNTVQLESLEKESLNFLQVPQREILENLIITSSMPRTTQENLEQTVEGPQGSLKALKQEEVKQKFVRADGLMKVAESPDSQITREQPREDSNSAKKDPEINSQTRPVIPPEAETLTSSLQVNLSHQDNLTEVKAKDLEIPSVVSNQDQQAFNSRPIDITTPHTNPQLYQVQKGDTLKQSAESYGGDVSELMKVGSTSSQVKPEVKESYSEKVSNAYASKLKSEVASIPETNSVIPVKQLQEPQETQSISREEPKPIVNLENLPKPSLVGTNSPDMTIDLQEQEGTSFEQNNSSWLKPPSGMPLGNIPPFTGYKWPTKGVISSGYGRRWGRMHKGIDIAASVGTPVVAAAPGEVISAGWNSGGYGNLVVVRHANRSVTFYAHNSRIFVHKGEIVHQGEQISAMGTTGHSTGSHLHFEIRPDGNSAANPMAFLPNQP